MNTATTTAHLFLDQDEETEDSSRRDAIDRASIAAMRGNCIPAVLTNVALALVLSATAWDAMPTAHAAGWMICVLLINAIRALLWTRFPATDAGVDDYKAWASAYTAATFVAGALWGAAGFLFMLPDNMVVQFILIISLLGICTGAVSALAAWQPTLLAFIGPTLLPVAVAYAAEATPAHLIVAGMCALFFAMLQLTGRNFNRTIRNSLEAKFRSEALATDLRRAKEAAEAANRSKSRFLSSMSHELRTPLNAIIGFTELMAYHPTDPINDRQRGYVGNIEQAGQHLLNLIDQVLNMAEIESGAVDITFDAVPPHAVVEDCLTILAPLATKHAVTLHGFDEPPPPVRGDTVRVKQVLLNLLSNAIKYNRLGGTVHMTWEKVPGGRVRINVVDNGFGISEDKQEDLFTPFSRLGVEASNIAGSGIGLTICKQLMELMDGETGFETTVGEGSTFWIELPQAEA